ncbi:MAG: ribonuclease HII [Sphingomonadaceae bacterium]|uniref:ribonuclease HII n=1 Tax=Thermaurantiacus sp. TaxID=2820283 RepID=UPI00298F340E|nr:ribonuclease HII [Thermaurantiacus sp.]MCS6987857.1 ribonuclease HII [Sphingomonadaceae bacterium]MDW8414923.1 ribonuclease HII [Thermaurantiacus sp.]
MGIVFGVDEVGRGPLAGPVLAAAVCWWVPVEGVRDSKALRASARERLAVAIRRACPVALGAASAREIDRRGVLEASLEAMARAVARLVRQVGPPDLVLVDGDRLPPLTFPARAVVRGDAREPAIAAASIVAKVARDRLMVRLGAADPRFGFEVHKGYPTARHLAALAVHGPGPHHRRSFHPVRSFLVT